MSDTAPEQAPNQQANTPPDETPEYSPNAIHMVRTVQLNTLTLSQMADQKASILMGATFLVFSLTVSRALVGEASWAILVLAFTAFVSSLCAVIAVIPSVGQSAAPVGPPNRLFFGHFSHLDEAEWTEDLLTELQADETVFRTMLHDIYQNGKVLQRRKYRYLAIAYRIFVAGLFATMAIYLAETFELIPT